MNKETLFCLEFSLWKKMFIQKFLPNFKCRHLRITSFLNMNNCGNKESHFSNNNKLNVAYWASKEVKDNSLKLLSSENIHVLRIEDGFIRSNGLGSNFYYPYSLVFDDIGIYYDPNTPSKLEVILEDLNRRNDIETLRSRAKKLQESIIVNSVSKYCLGKTSASLEQLKQRVHLDSNKFDKVIFIPAQVDDDASIILGGCDYSNLKVLKEVRNNNPNAFIIFKIHPDVIAGNRKNNSENCTYDTFRSLANFVCVNELSNLECIDISNEIHTISSLTGFEALLRNKKVFCYGMPFYAGYGLTTDLSVISKNEIALKAFNRRKKIAISLIDLVVGSLILYPTYYNWNNSEFSTVEDIINTLLGQSKSKQNVLCYMYSKFIKHFK